MAASSGIIGRSRGSDEVATSFGYYSRTFAATLPVMAGRIGLFGGSFDPIHHGHLIVARAVAERHRLDRMLFLPSATPPHKATEGLTSARHRAEMVKLGIAGEPLFEFSDVDLSCDGPSYTIDTIRRFRDRFDTETVLCWLIGGDWLGELPTWRSANELIDSCEIITAVRPGWDGVDWSRMEEAVGSDRLEKLRSGLTETPRIEISSTDIRRRVSEGRSICFLTPACVVAYIETHALYRVG